MKTNPRAAGLWTAAALAALGVCALSVGAIDAAAQSAQTTQSGAQTAKPVASADVKASADDSSRVITPRKSESAARMKRASAPKDAAPVDWARLRAQIEETRARDSKFVGQTAPAPSERAAGVPQRPGGIRRIDLQKLKTPAQAAPSQASVVARARETKLPILVPAAAEVLEALKVYPLENAYAANAVLKDGTEIHIMGTRLRVVGGDPAIAKARFASRQRLIRRLPDIAAPYVVSRHEEGVDLSFSLFNVAYLVTVRCADPETDPRCTGENYVGALVRDLGILNADAGDGQ